MLNLVVHYQVHFGHLEGNSSLRKLEICMLESALAVSLLRKKSRLRNEMVYGQAGRKGGPNLYICKLGTTFRTSRKRLGRTEIYDIERLKLKFQASGTVKGNRIGPAALEMNHPAWGTSVGIRGLVKPYRWL